MKTQILLFIGVVLLGATRSFALNYHCSDEKAISLFSTGQSRDISLSVENGLIRVSNESGEVAVMGLVNANNGYHFYESISENTAIYGVSKANLFEAEAAFAVDLGDYRSEEKQNHYYCVLSEQE